MAAYPYLLRSMAQIKKAAARANQRIGALDPEKAQAIAAACDEIIAGQHAQEFIVTLLEGSGGTSMNMNTNEVVANRALQISGNRAGAYETIDLLTKGARLFRERCIEGISLNRQRCYENLRNSAALATIFIPALGYSTVSQLVKEAEKEERPFITLAVDRGLISEDEVELTLRAATAYPFKR